MTTKEPRVLLSLPMAFQDGIDKYNGIMRFIGERKLRWHITLNRLALSYDHSSIADLPTFDGLIADSGITPRIAKAYVASGLPLVAIDWRHPELGRGHRRFIRIDSDSAGIARIAVQTLFATGQFAAFAYFPCYQGISWAEARGEEFRRLLNRKAKTVHILQARGTTLERQLRLLPKPAAVFAANDFAAMKILAAAAREGLSIPEDLSILGVDNDRYACLHSHPTLASIEPNFDEAGYLSAEALAAMFAHRRVAHRQVYRAKGVAQRESLDAPGTAGALVRKALLIIKDSYSEFHGVDELALRLGVSRRLLDKRFRQIEGRSVLDAIQDRRMDEVLNQLKNTSLPIRTICENSPFKSITYPMRLFKKRFGTTMYKWRKNKMQVT